MMNTRLLLALALAGCVDTPDTTTDEAEIINGSPVEAESSGIPMLGNGCSSVLLSNNWVLTAAHCVDTFVDYKFSADGQATAYFPEGQATTRALAIDSYGQPIVGGTVAGKFAIAKFRTNGAIDPYFNGGSGKVIDFASSTEEAINDIAIDSSNRIVAVGTAVVNGRTVIAIARYLSTGALDTSFDGDGKVLTDWPAFDYMDAQAVAIDKSNRIVIAARVDFEGDPRYAVMRYRTDGAIDGNWSGDGFVMTEISGSAGDFVEDIAIDSQNRVLVAGTSNGKMGLARFTAAGNIDTSFSGDGEVQQGYGTTLTQIFGIAVDASDRAIVVGKSQASSGLLVGRITTAGALDTTFDGDGWLTYLPRWRYVNASARAVTVDAQGRIIVTGNATDGNGAHATLVLRLKANGAVDTTFGSDGSVDWYSTNDAGTYYEAWGVDVGVDPSGNLYVAQAASILDSASNPAYRMGIAHVISEHLNVAAWPGLTAKMGSQTVNGANVYVHSTLDVALVKLATPLVMNGRTTGYEFHGFDIRNPAAMVGEDMECYGYGKNTYDGGYGVLRHGQLTVDSATANEYRLVPNEYGQITFSGDSGGPCYSTVNGWKVSGITSWGSSSPSTKTVNDTYNVAAIRFADWVSGVRTIYGS